jgi:hypothetical protein
MMFFHITGVMRCSKREYGLRFSRLSQGGSVAKASEAKVSCITITIP